VNRRLLRDLDILTVRLFIAVCEEGTLTRAAEREAIAPSAVSKRLAELETALGVALFVRQAKGMTLTSAGQTMLYHSRRMIQNVHNIGIELGEYAKGVRGYVRMVANISSIVQFLPEDLENFLTRHSEIKVDLAERPSRRVVDEIEDDKADIGICAGETDTRHLARVPYHQDHLLVVLRPDHPLAKEPSVAFRQTLAYDYVGLHGDSTIFARSVMASRQIDLPLKLKIHVPSFDALCRMVQANLGIGLMPDRAFDVMGRPLGLQAIPLTDDWAQRELVLVHRSDRSLAPCSRMMLDHLAAVGQRSPMENVG